MAADFGAMAVAARDLAFDIRAGQSAYGGDWSQRSSSHTWGGPSYDKQQAFRVALCRLQERKYVVPRVFGETYDVHGGDWEHVEALLQFKCPPVPNPVPNRKWILFPQSILENGAIACRRIEVEAKRLHDLAVAARGKRGSLPRAGLHRFIVLCDRLNAQPAQIVRALADYLPGQSKEKIRELVKRTRRTVRENSRQRAGAHFPKTVRMRPFDIRR
jgi:hypothetical protein